MKIATATAVVVGALALINGDLLVAGICFSAAMLFWLKSE